MARITFDEAAKQEADVFVLDLQNDPHAEAALRAYAWSCKWSDPALSNRLRDRADDLALRRAKEGQKTLRGRTEPPIANRYTLVRWSREAKQADLIEPGTRAAFEDGAIARAWKHCQIDEANPYKLTRFQEAWERGWKRMDRFLEEGGVAMCQECRRESS